jgi:hypothetical protein
MLSVMKLNKENNGLKIMNSYNIASPMNLFKAKDDKNVCKEKEAATIFFIP